MKSTLVFAVLVALFGPIANAQNEENVFKAKLLPVGLSGSVAGLYFLSEGEPSEFRAAMTGLGSGIDYEGSRVFSLYASENDAIEATGDAPPAPVASVKLPEGEERILLMVAKSGEDKLSMRAYGVSLDGFRSGDYRFYNMCRENVAIILGSKKFALRPGDTETVTSNQWQREIMDLPIKLGKMVEGEQTKMVYSSVWGHQPKRRNMILIFKGPNKAKPFEVRRYYDVPGTENQE